MTLALSVVFVAGTVSSAPNSAIYYLPESRPKPRKSAKDQTEFEKGDTKQGSDESPEIFSGS